MGKRMRVKYNLTELPKGMGMVSSLCLTVLKEERKQWRELE